MVDAGLYPIMDPIDKNLIVRNAKAYEKALQEKSQGLENSRVY